MTYRNRRKATKKDLHMVAGCAEMLLDALELMDRGLITDSILTRGARLGVFEALKKVGYNPREQTFGKPRMPAAHPATTAPSAEGTRRS